MTNGSTAYRTMDRCNVVQHELIPELEARWGVMTPKLERVIHILEWVRIEEFTAVSWCGLGRPPFARAWLANAFVAKAVLGVTTTVGLLDRLMNDRTLRRICAFPLYHRLLCRAIVPRREGLGLSEGGGARYDEYAQHEAAGKRE